MREGGREVEGGEIRGGARVKEEIWGGGGGRLGGGVGHRQLF